MESTSSHIEGASRYLFDEALIPKGFSQLDSRQDAWYYGNWFNPTTLEWWSYAEGDVTITKYAEPEEFIGHVLAQKEVLGLEHIDDWSQNWAVPIEFDELTVYLSYMRDDAIQ